MSFPEFTAVVRDHPGGVVVKLRGEVDGPASNQIATILRGLVKDGARYVVVDLRLAELGDAAALDPIIRTFMELEGEGGDLVLRDPSVDTRRLLDSAGLKKKLRVIES